MIWRPDDYYFSRIEKNDLPELLAFYIIEIYEHFNYTDYTVESYENELEHLLKEDHAFYKNSIYYVLRDCKEHKIYGSIKTTYWDKETPLPIEELFDVSAQDLLLPGIDHFWHIGRFVISRKIPKDRISILKKILYNAFYPVYKMGSGLIIAECDKKVTLTLEKLNVTSFVLGKSIEYICSETLPIYIRSEWLNEFVSSNADRYFSTENVRDVQFFSNMTRSLIESSGFLPK